MKVVGYVRVSTRKQAKEGHSIEYQIEEIKRFCEYKKLELVKIFKDEGVSAFKERKGFYKCLNYVFDDKADGVVVYELSRFGRSTIELLTTIEKLNTNGKRFYSIKENIDLTSKEGKLLLQLLSAIAEYERAVTLERIAAGREYAIKQGKKIGRPRKKIDWKQVEFYRNRGLSFNAIAKIINVTTPTLIKRYKERYGVEG